MQYQPSFVATHQMPLSLWSQCVVEQEAIYAFAQRQTTASFKAAAACVFGSADYVAAWKRYQYWLDRRALERNTLLALSSYYTKY